jgi:hypothetical protein
MTDRMKDSKTVLHLKTVLAFDFEVLKLLPWGLGVGSQAWARCGGSPSA